MFFKKNLIDQSIYIKQIPDQYLSIDYKTLEKDALDSFEKKQFANSNDFSPFKNYYRVKDNPHVKWIYDLIRDYFNLQNFPNERTPILFKSNYIVLNRGVDIPLHQHIDEYDLHNSPDISSIITIASNENSFIEFQYEGGRKRHMTQRVPLIEKEIIVFNSELKHRFLVNKDFKNVVLLSFQMQLI